jgi:hypothetical protein
MKKVTHKISPTGFDLLQRVLMRAQNSGWHSPEICAGIALTSIGLTYTIPSEITFVIDWSLDGPIYPFEDWPEYTEKELAYFHAF